MANILQKGCAPGWYVPIRKTRLPQPCFTKATLYLYQLCRLSLQPYL